MPVITDSITLARRIAALENEPYVTVDTEFVRERTYYPELCLVQIGGKNDAFCIDPLDPTLDLQPFYALMHNPNIVKVFHACEQDVEMIFRLSGKLPMPLFDTQVAAQMLGFGEAIGYGNLVETVLKITLDKSSRLTDWSQRPLTAKQIDYALSDVTHLRNLYEKLRDKLVKKGRLEWALEEMEYWQQPESYRVDPDTAWMKIKTRGGKGPFLSVVKELAAWREKTAQADDRPRQWVLKDDLILNIAASLPETLQELQNVRLYTSKRDEKGYALLDIIKRAKTTPPPKVERKKLPKGAMALIEVMKLLLKIQCEEHDVAQSTVASGEDIERLATEEVPDIRCLRGWRYDVFGKYAIALKESRLAITVEKNRVVLIEPQMDE